MVGVAGDPVASTAGRVRAWVDPQALRDNLAVVRRLAPQAAVMAVIKADGYGHGALRVAAALAGQVESFAVAALSEAVALREGGRREPICVLGGLTEAEQWDRAEALGLTVVVHAQYQLDELRRRAAPPRFWLKFDTGMGRLGFAAAEAGAVAAQLDARLQACCAGVMTHMACADEEDAAALAHMRGQLQALETHLRGAFPEARLSVANSASVVAWPQTRVGLMRPGLMLYGVLPFALDSAARAGLGLRPAMRLEARVLDVKTLPAGHGAGYGATWTAPTATRIAILAAGYADGILRSLAGSDSPLQTATGHALPLRGRVSMDMIAAEVPADATLAPGDWVGLWGAGAQAVEVAAAAAGTAPYELLTALGGRVAHGEASLGAAITPQAGD